MGVKGPLDTHLPTTCDRKGDAPDPICETERGHDEANLPLGETTPNSKSASAGPTVVGCGYHNRGESDAGHTARGVPKALQFANLYRVQIVA